MIASETSLRVAIHNIALWGDTDVLPFPLENHWFHDAPEDIVGLLTDLDANFDTWRSRYPVLSDRLLAAVGYVGFRSATQIDPIWNAYLLALAVELGPEIEQARLPSASNRVFSYRFAVDSSDFTLFDRAIGWTAFQNHALEQAKAHKYVLSTDISDFYPRVYHHRIDNALGQATRNKEAARRATLLVSDLALGGVSFGLPVGGNAARLLAELILTRTDSLLNARGIAFCRFVDDYYIFAASEEEARRSVVYLSDLLLAHEGLSLQRGKTRIMPREEFLRTSPVAEVPAADSEVEDHAQRFLKLRLTYDPYSPTADSDYERLRTELEKFDIVGMLARELRKTRIDEVLVRQLVKSVRYLDQGLRDAAVESLIKNLPILYPLIPTVVLVIRGLLNDLSSDVKGRLFTSLRELIESGSYVFLVPANLAYALRLLVHDSSEAADTLLVRLYHSAQHMLLKRDLILCLALRRVDYAVSDILKRHNVLTPWERRALIPASYILGDEGKYWRQTVRGTLDRVDQSFLSWVGSKNDGRVWEIPL